MRKVRTLAKLVINKGVFNRLDDVQYLKLIYWAYMGKKLDLKNPKRFTEKLQWLKIHDRKPYYSTMVDKYAVKEYVTKIIGDEYVIPTYGVWDSPRDIDFDLLPNKFVLKTTHDSGTVKIIDKTKGFDKESLIDYLEKRQKRRF